jgi:redox-sensitive bicupin YhaK (pirin superfamily)
MNTLKPIFVREVARIDDPQFVSGQAAGHRARRLIDALDAAFADPFVLMAEDWTSQGALAFHLHRGIETVTFVIEGSIEHHDSAGYGGVIHAGGAQWMTAGRGVQHEENPPAGTIAHTLQLWVNLPAAEKMAVPRYQDLVASALPVRSENGVEIGVFPEPMAIWSRLRLTIILLRCSRCGSKTAGAKSEKESVLYCKGLRRLRGEVNSYAKST